MTQLHATSDIVDEIIYEDRVVTQDHIEQIIAYLASIGVSRLEWIVDEVWNLYDDYQGGFDLLEAAVETAHRHGMELQALIKPFEGAITHMPLPHGVPCPDGVPMWTDLRGHVPAVRPFVAAHPEYCMAVRPGLEDPGTPVAEVRVLVPVDVPVEAIRDSLSVWVGTSNGDFRAYDGAASVTAEDTEVRVNGVAQPCRQVVVSGLHIEADDPYVELRVDGVEGFAVVFPDHAPTVDLLDAAGNTIPSTTSVPEAFWRRERVMWWLERPARRQVTRWGCTEEAARYFAEPTDFLQRCEAMRHYDTHWGAPAASIAVPEQRIGAVRGVPPVLPGILNPVYPEVRAYWLEQIQYCIDRGVDGVNIRPTHHYHPARIMDYGFNPPVLEACGGTPDWPKVTTCIGDAFTTFLDEARDLLHAHDKLLGVHLMQRYPDPVPTRHEWVNMFPCVGRNWKHWVAEIADYVEYRVGAGEDEDLMRTIIDPFAEVCLVHGVPFTYQGHPALAQHDYPPAQREALKTEMSWVQQRKSMQAYLLYETHNILRFDPDQGFVGSEDLRTLLAECGLPRHEATHQLTHHPEAMTP